LKTSSRKRVQSSGFDKIYIPAGSSKLAKVIIPTVKERNGNLKESINTVILFLNN